MKVALVYDRVNKWGGAERVLLALHKIFPDAPLYTSVYDKDKAPWAKVFSVKTSFLQNFPFASGNHEYYAPLMPLAFESFTFDEYDLVISVTSEAAKGIITKPGTLHICYCLTPTRYLWSGYDEYFKNPILRFISKPVVSYLRFWDRIASQRPDTFIAISREVQKRIKKYYNRDSDIIYPPIQIQNPKLQIPNKSLNTKYKIPNTEYFLIVSRLVPYKKIDLAVKVFNKLGLPLKIVGTGIEENRLKRMAKPNIEFLGYLTDKELVEYYKECQALIFPQEEDFGLTIPEAQSFGKPVIALKKGGALDIVTDGKTGIFFEVQSKKSLEDAILKFQKMNFNPQDSIKNAEKFNFEEFKIKLKKEISLATSL
ncbi:MAG: hypothetical protein A2860_02305 [Candidatus Levybacteria bacterium RIFCSPHIGHO2_01_FULL_37_33]|nr:MAG: hypothetical protein A2860_02305 [Candidatus Levybacteria bacterium RIFCSPHIGHO2_01_FULL_37_33]OGH16891.1 MAG: hypothetical protein A3C97_03440 [Candidatus Levybacteria bacterium RIFCSPHIGHO2_02_FULL_37_11]OGH29685.1 MAG: hypothetical protein A3F30_02090 [Candidatus Levybacteria bacterium RIFCSPHIGHO2_12_FULL_37_12]OGH32682.1 MAG: hypothetical protein A2953_01440 [Candidatus Levybacteria bacterium RIFCSPLOWO2_01_FULL_36_54]